MKIVYLLESAARIWGGVKSVLDAANHLQDRGHAVTVLCKSAPPTWMDLRCTFTTVPSFAPEHIPSADLIVGTYWTTVPFAADCGKGQAVHYCQGYEGDNPELHGRRAQVEAVYARRDVPKITISPHLTRLVDERFGQAAHEIVYGIDDTVMFPPDDRPPHHPVRVGLVGPYEIAWKDIRTGIAACRLAHAAGLQLELVRITNTAPHAEEREQPFPVEWHEQVPPRQMGDLYRSIDVFLGTSLGPQEGFFLPAMEAMACGVPCVLTEIACFQGYGKGQYALFVEPGDPAEMAKALVLVAAHPRVAAGLRVEGLRVASRYTMRNHIDDLERTFGELAARRTPARTETMPRQPALRTPRPPAASELQTLPPAELHLAGLTHGIAKTLCSAAELFLQSGHYGEAVDHLEAAAKLLPDDVPVLHNLAQAQFLKGDDDAALQVYDRLLALGEHDADLHTSRALVLFNRGDLLDAVRGFEAAIAAGDRSAATHNNLGVALHGIGDHARARQSFEAALRLEPDYLQARDNLDRLTPQKSR